MSTLERQEYEKRLRDGVFTGIQHLLWERWGKEGLRLFPDIRITADDDKLLTVIRVIATAASLDEAKRSLGY